MTQNITLSDYFLSAQPFDLFGALQPGYSGIEISFDGKENRLLSLPNDVSTEGIRDALLTEFDFYTKVRAALRQAFALAPFKKGQDSTSRKFSSRAPILRSRIGGAQTSSLSMLRRASMELIARSLTAF